VFPENTITFGVELLASLRDCETDVARDFDLGVIDQVDFANSEMESISRFVREEGYLATL